MTGPLADFDVVLQELHPPVGDGREHRHTGPVLGCVLEFFLENQGGANRSRRRNVPTLGAIGVK